MTLKLIRIGSSRGVRIPKKLIEQFNFGEELDMEIRKEGLLLKSKVNPRSGWRRDILEEIDDGGYPETVIPEGIKNDFDDSEWQW